MDKTRKIIPVLLLFALLLSSCIPTTHTTRTRAFYPNANLVQLRLNMNDLELVGEVEVSVTYQKYLGITIMNEVNGETWDPYHRRVTDIKGLSFGASSKLDKAAGKIIDQFPRAAYYYVVYMKKDVQKSFLSGKEIVETAVIRVYDYKINLKEK